ncbi:MAG: Zn-finger protein [Thorarchaeia virus VerdaV2]|uniref:Zn-finger protein n=1 Tax=Thorarchaeia virus VerdaV2 TaxID=3070171 RepID=A0AA35GBP6_9CAUD|nr:MAG: Zn-finger protein [Thorarchaeia virus VerdaV2]BDI54919.1 MAG: Zn-finger protein [Thorarchaeia virus VerdaV2]
MTKVEIQCPECGGPIVPEAKGIKSHYVCLSCRLVFTEAEIRERCGL